MLPAPYRLRRSTDFSSAVRSGARVGSRRVVVHQHIDDARGSVDGSARVGLIVSKAVGGSVVRHRVSRRLRAQIGQRLDALPASSTTVIRALPAAAAATSAAFGRDLDRALSTLAGGR